MRPVYVTQNGTGSSAWKLINNSVSPTNVSLGVVTAGTATYTVEYTLDDPTGTYPNPRGSVTVYALSALSGGTTTGVSSITVPVAAVRLTNTGAGTGTSSLTILQAGIAGP